ncbi:AAA family ATPase [Maioricimonas sp. JC845]|uniref:AAA family ATPase n=1 Tax=Maioricimonas sp. JC845 TaxID=3232138 RepID=UPI00345A140B
MATTTAVNAGIGDPALLAALLSGEKYWPSEPRSTYELGLSEPFLETLVAKVLLSGGNCTGRRIASEICLPFSIVEATLERLRTRRLVTHVGAGQLNDYVYGLTEDGRARARVFHQECAYVGPAPVPLMDYVISVEAQAIGDEPIRRCDLADAFHDVSVSGELLDLLGPAVNSAGGLFLYGAPGNGKSTLANRITSCFGQEVWLPYAVIDGREIITVFDPAYHRRADRDQSGEAATHDRRWVRVQRPTVVVGGELTMDNLEIRHDPVSKISEAPLQMKSNCGCLLIDDFGRQRISPEDLLNRWIIPLENRHDYLTLATGKKIQIPFQQLIIFSTNLDPSDLVDEAFLRRIPYRIEVRDPDEDEFHNLFQLAAENAGCSYNPEAVEHLLDNYYRDRSRPLRRCHARDLLMQVRNYCTYNDVPFEMIPEHFDRVAHGFFTRVPTRDLAADPRPARTSV